MVEVNVSIGQARLFWIILAVLVALVTLIVLPVFAPPVITETEYESGQASNQENGQYHAQSYLPVSQSSSSSSSSSSLASRGDGESLAGREGHQVLQIISQLHSALNTGARVRQLGSVAQSCGERENLEY